MQTGGRSHECVFNCENLAYFVGNVDGRHGLWYSVLFVLGKPLGLGGGASGGGQVGDKGGLVVYHACGDFPAALGLVDAALQGHAVYLGRGVAVSEVDVGAVCAGRCVLAAGGVAANQDGAAGGCGLGGGGNTPARALSALPALLGAARLPRVLRHRGDLFVNGNETDLTRLIAVGLQFWQPEKAVWRSARFGFASARLASKPKGVLAINILAAFAP